MIDILQFKIAHLIFGRLFWALAYLGGLRNAGFDLQGNKRVFYELDMEDTIRSQLAHKTVFEYPVIHVALSADPVKFPSIISKPSRTATLAAPVPDAAEPDDDDEEFQEFVGKYFREEEIEEGEFIP